jgi:transcriptional regulator with XRE-family HTH domain
MTAKRSPTFADQLRDLRRASGLSQEELAERAGMSVRALRKLESGATQTPRRDTIDLLASALHLDATAQAAFAQAARQSWIARSNVAAQPQRHLRSSEPLLIGRAAELALVARHLAASTPPLLALLGEPGIGKSRLLAEAGGMARATGWTVLSGGCARRSGQEPYAPVVEMLADTIQASSLAKQRRDLSGCSWLARLVPELAEARVVPVPQWQLPPEHERRLILAAVPRYLANIAGPSGTLLLLDDLHWAGQDALDLLASLARPRTGATSLRLLGACRDTEIGPDAPLALFLADLAREGLAASHQLAPLSREEAGELAQLVLEGRQQGAAGTGRAEAGAVAGGAGFGTDGSGVDGSGVDGSGVDGSGVDGLAAALATRTGGRPYFLVSCALAVRAAREQGTTPQELEATLIPWNIAASLRQRIALLPETAQEILGVAATVGRRAPRTLLIEVEAQLGRAEPELLSALEATDRAALLLEASSDAYEFAHDLVREVVAKDLSAARRAALHRHVGEALEGLPAHKQTPAELAWHFQQAGEMKRALPYALLAGEQARATYAYAEALQHYRAAVEAAQDVGDPACEAEALEGLSSVQLTLARHSEALATIDTALLAYQTLGDVEGQARLAEGALRAHSALASFDVGIARFGPMIDDLQVRGLSALGQARLHSALAHVLHRGAFYDAGETAPGRLSEAVLAAERAMTLARAGGDDEVLAQAILAQGLALGWLGRLEEALDVIEGALPLAEASGDIQLLFFTLVQAQIGREIHGDFELSQRYVDRGLAVSDRAGAPPLAAHMWFNQAELAYYRGDWTLARKAIRRSLEIAQSYALEVSSLQARRYLAHLSLAAGEQERADALLAAPLALASERHDLQVLRMAHTLIAERDLLAGRAEAVRTYLEPLLDRPGLEELQVLFILPQYAWALLALGDEEGAEIRAMQSCERARAHHYGLWLVDGLWVLAMVRMRQARWEEARALLEEAIAQCRTMPYPYAEVKTLFVYSQLHTAKGELGQARGKYEAALALCDQLGEGLYRPHIEHALALLGA